MYILKTENGREVLVIKHLELAFYEQLELSLKSKLKEKYLIGVYYGSYSSVAPDFRYIDFVVAGDRVIDFECLDVPRLFLSGFNFMPDSIVHNVRSVDDVLKSTILYIGDLSPRKNFIELIKLAFFHSGFRYTALMRCANRFDRFILIFLKVLLQKNIEILLPKNGLTFNRNTVFNEISRSELLFVPYLKEGAARVVAEADCLGKPIIFNMNMLGGSHVYLRGDENIFYQGDCKDIDFSRGLCLKNPSEKMKFYSEVNNSKLVSSFFTENFNLNIIYNAGDFCNAFSGHQNILPSAWTNEKTDEILDVNGFNIFLLDNIGSEALGRPRPDRFNIVSYEKLLKKTVLKLRYLARILAVVIYYRFRPQG